MKKTHVATLKFLCDGGKSLYEICKELRRIYPEMNEGINMYNMSRMLGFLLRKDYVMIAKGMTHGEYAVTYKGRVYLYDNRGGGL